MEEFLDTNIVIDYINCNEGSSGKVEASAEYVKNIKGEIILCGFVVWELKNRMKKNREIHVAVLNKMKGVGGDFFKLGRREGALAKKVYLKVGEMDIEKVSEFFSEQRDLFEIGLEKFLKFSVDRVVVGKEDIDSKLVSEIKKIISNVADCSVLASALRYQKGRGIFNFVTADRDFDENIYDYLKEHFKINCSEDGFIFPRLVNLLSV